MKKAYVNPNKCDRSPFCASKRACPVKAISQESQGFFNKGPAVVDKALCIGCKKCIDYCPHNAITMR
ncbi:4Fe-4S binding protein [Clostridium sp. DL1XJH146]